MASIDAGSPLAALIRAQLAAQQRPALRQGPADGDTPMPAGGRAGQAAPSPPAPGEPRQPQGLPRGAVDAQALAVQVRALSPDDPDRVRKAYRLFMASTLSRSLGGHERLDGAELDQLVDGVLSRMEDDPQLRAALHEAGQRLLAQAMPGA